MALTREQDLSILLYLAKPLAKAPERFEEFLEIAEQGDSPRLTKSLQALRAAFARAFETPADTPEERERRVREIAEALHASPDREERLAGYTLRAVADKLYRRR